MCPDLRAAINADRIDLAICPIDILDEGSGLVFQEVLPGRNIVACRATHPLLCGAGHRASCSTIPG